MIFFVDLPDSQVRATIFEIHLRQRKYDPAEYDLKQMAETSDGFSGAEIEQVVVSALYTAFSENTALSTAHLLKEIAHTGPCLRHAPRTLHFCANGQRSVRLPPNKSAARRWCAGPRLNHSLPYRIALNTLWVHYFNSQSQDNRPHLSGHFQFVQ